MIEQLEPTTKLKIIDQHLEITKVLYMIKMYRWYGQFDKNGSKNKDGIVVNFTTLVNRRQRIAQLALDEDLTFPTHE